MKAKSSAKFLGQTRRAAMLGNVFLAGRVAVAAVIAFVLSAQLAVADPHPNMYLNQAEIDAIKEKVADNIEPWASAYVDVISGEDSAANKALNQAPLSVTFQLGSSNQYKTINPRCGWTKVDGKAPDCRPGPLNPNQDRGDYNAAIALGNAVRDLGLGYVFTGENKYADKAIELIRVWSLDSATRMATDETAMRIELFISLPGYFYGADLIWGYDGWGPGEKTAFRSWVKKIGDLTKARQVSAIRSANGTATNLNNFANWRNVLIASAGALLDDQDLLDYVEETWKHLISVQMNGVGSQYPGFLGQEVGRSEGIHYSLYAVNAMIQGAEIMRHRGVNLYDHVDGAGKSLELALGFITPFAINPASWNEFENGRYTQTTPITSANSMALYELAYSYYQDSIYLEAINRWGRPMDEIRVMGINTLTHANRFELNMSPVAPSIITQPNAATVMEGEDATFSVVASGSGPLSYQWYRDGNSINGATSASYTVTGAGSSDSGVFYRCDISNSEGNAQSDTAELTVLSDNIAPTLASAVAVNNTRVDILFSEPVSTSSAENTTNYQVDLGIGVTAVSLNDDERTVSLMVSPALAEETTYTVSVSNVQDQANTPNTIVALSTEIFIYRTADDFEDGVADGWTPLTPGRWQVTLDEGDNVYHLHAVFDSLNGVLGEYSLLAADYSDFTFTAQIKLGDAVSSNPLADYAVVFGYQDPDNYYFVMFNNTQNNTQLFKVIDGNRTELATAESDWLNDNSYHAIEVSRAGSAITVRFDGNVILNANDASLGVGRVGVGSFNDTAYFDDVSVTGTVSTMPDTTVPVITLFGVNPQKITVDGIYVELSATATDNVDGDISANIVIDASVVDTTTVGSYNVTYNVSDAESNAAIEVTRTVNVVAATVGNGGGNDTNDDNGGAGSFGVWGLLALLIMKYGFVFVRRTFAGLTDMKRNA